MVTQSYDLLVIGGGIHGAAVARDAAGRGLKVMLAEKGDYACATSSASSKLIHGGLRYLEQLELSLVRESLVERAGLLKTAPHLVEPIRFFVPIYGWQKRPALLLHAGLGNRGCGKRVALRAVWQSDRVGQNHDNGLCELRFSRSFAACGRPSIGRALLLFTLQSVGVHCDVSPRRG